MNFPDEDLSSYCDGQQINRALTNLLKNASESVISRIEETNGDPNSGAIELSISSAGASPEGQPSASSSIQIKITDNGKGLPLENRDRLTEPYMTTRTKGTGLGLAIVKKIVEDHGGTLTLSDHQGGGAEIYFTLSTQAPLTGSDQTDELEKTPLEVEIELAIRSAGE